MLIAEYDYDLDIEVQREEAYEAGQREGLKAGHAIGLKDGEIKGVDRVNRLNNLLIMDGRLEDLKKATNDEAYQKKMMEEYNL